MTAAAVTFHRSPRQNFGMAVRLPRSLAMKRELTISVLLVLLLASFVRAQESASDPSDLTVLKKSWQKSFFIPRRDQNVLRANEDLIQQTRVEKKAIENRDTALPNQPTESRLPAPGPRPIGGPPVDTYIYKITVKNTGTKHIRTIDWEYQFLHPETKEVLGSQRIFSKVKVFPGKTKTVEGQSTRPPARLVSADQLDKKFRDQFEERVIIHRIYYTDGPSWRRQP